MKKITLFVGVLGMCFTPFVKAQESGARSSGSTTQQRVVVPNSPNASYRNNSNINSFAPSVSTPRQQVIPQSSEWRTMNTQEKRNVVSNMSSKERSQFYHKMKEDIVFEDLNISHDKEEEFKSLFEEYQSSQKRIREKFIIENNLDKLSDEEATKRLNQSFEVGQQLLNNRKAYAEKFLKMLSPQQVLKLFQTEGKLRDRVLDKKNNDK